LNVAELAAEALGAAIDAPTAPVSIQGSAGTGKTAVGVKIAELARNDGRLPIHLRPPIRAPEAGPIMVSDALGSLGVEQPWGEEGGFGRALLKLRWALGEQREQVIVIADEPSSWVREGGYFSALTGEAITIFLTDTAWPTVVLDQNAHDPLVRLSSLPFEGDFAGWGELAEAGATVAETPGPLARNPLEVAFSVALLAWGRALPEAPASASRLAETLVEVLAKRRLGPRVWAVWQRLALARTELPDAVLAQLGASELDPLGADTLKHILLDPAGRLHDIARVIAEREERASPIGDAERAEVNRTLFEYHRDAAAQADSDAEAGRHAAEALFHIGELGEEPLIDTVSVMFVEQLNALGRTLSQQHHDHFNAAAVFRRAIDIDDSNDYAQHYRGFNLDFQGEGRSEVAERYEKALEIDPSNPWWHARKVTFLADTGRLRESRAAWDRAESEASAGTYADYSDLHSWVAGALLHQGELTFADYVLGSVPIWAETDEIADLRRALGARLQAQDVGTVVPAPRSWGRWWTQGPSVLATRDTDGRALVSWIAGRVDSVDETGVHLRAGFVEMDGAKPELGAVTIGRERWEASCLDPVDIDRLRPGRFLELGNYESDENGKRLAIRIVHPDPYRQPTPPIMPLDRWIRSVGVA
jgi:tetratricopeptide (TPR) repeat protein